MLGKGNRSRPWTLCRLCGEERGQVVKWGSQCPVSGGDATGSSAAWIPGPLFPDAPGPASLSHSAPSRRGRPGAGRVQRCGRRVGTPAPPGGEGSAERRSLQRCTRAADISDRPTSELRNRETWREGGEAVGGEEGGRAGMNSSLTSKVTLKNRTLPLGAFRRKQLRGRGARAESRRTRRLRRFPQRGEVAPVLTPSFRWGHSQAQRGNLDSGATLGIQFTF